jgi:hypothetical protein
MATSVVYRPREGGTMHCRENAGGRGGRREGTVAPVCSVAAATRAAARHGIMRAGRR